MFYGTTFLGGGVNFGVVFQLLPPQTPDMISLALVAESAQVSFSGVGGYQYLVSRSPDRRRRDAVPAGVAGLSVVPWQRVPVRPRHAAQLIDDFPVPERQLAGQLPCALQPGS